MTNTVNKFFDAIYTTNFDDLINEAFYQFSQTRPVICAHDSSVNSISISTSRPKVIKLHGDYLFDDIKSTLRETESLESNIKNKLIEFSKEYGLIVIGYAGNDRSIMDVINYLLKTEDYLKNGIYWCLRKGDSINPELRRLLWKDRVYYVEIEGFDQVMAEFHHNLIGELSLKDNFTDSKRESIVNSFTDDKYSLSETSTLISQDIEKLKKHKTNVDISNLIRELSGNQTKNNNDETLSETDFKNLLSLDNLIKCKNFTLAKSQAESYISNCINDEIKTKYIKKLIYINNELELNDQALKLCEQLIEIDEFNADFAINKALNYRDKTERCKYINSVLKKFDNIYFFHNFLVNSGILEYKNSSNTPYFSVEKLLESVEKSLTLEPSLDNPAWILKLDVIEIKFEGSFSLKLIKEKEDFANNILKSIKSINSKSLVYYEAKTHNVIPNNKPEDSLEMTKELIELLLTSRNKKQKLIVDIICKIYFKLSSNDSYDSKLSTLKDFVNSDIGTNKKYANLASMHAIKAKYTINVERDIPKFLKIIYELSKAENSENWASFIISSLCEVGRDYKKAERYLNSIKNDISRSFFDELMFNIHVDNLNYELAIKSIEDAYENGISIDEYYVKKSFLLLKSQRYEQAISLINNNISMIKEKLALDTLIINREYANKKLNNKFDELAVRNIISRGLSSSLVLCAECLLEQDVKVKRTLQNVYSNDFLRLHSYAAWPVIPDKYMDVFFKNKVTNIINNNVA